MDKHYILGIDQSTQGTKAVLVDSTGRIQARCDLPHKQIINENGWVSHDGIEIYDNVLKLIPMVVEKAGINKNSVVAVGISNQRETTIAWDKETGKPLAQAVVWQCARASEIAASLEKLSQMICETTGIPLSPYFPASKMKWLLDNEALCENYGIGTMDSYLIYRLTGCQMYRTDYSNASRTQLMNIKELAWNSKMCNIFGIDQSKLPQIVDSDGDFGETDFGGYLDRKIPIRGVLGDSHGALFAQGCHRKGMVKTTYGTGSSIMMNVGDNLVRSKSGLVTSLAWRINGEANYVLEGNLNYTGAIVSWLKNDVGLVASAEETESLAKRANPKDTTCFIPAFSGLGAPYWKPNAKASFMGMTRNTGRNELVKATLDSISYQIADVVFMMETDSGVGISELRVDGGPTRNAYLMQFQSDILQKTVRASKTEELSVLGAVYMAGIAVGFYEADQLFTEQLGSDEAYHNFQPHISKAESQRLYQGWKLAIEKLM